MSNKNFVAGALLVGGFVFGTLIGISAGQRQGHEEAMRTVAMECGRTGEVDAFLARIECRIKRHSWSRDAIYPTHNGGESDHG